MRLVVANILVLEYCVLAANQVGQVITSPLTSNRMNILFLQLCISIWMEKWMTSAGQSLGNEENGLSCIFPPIGKILNWSKTSRVQRLKEADWIWSGVPLPNIVKALGINTRRLGPGRWSQVGKTWLLVTKLKTPIWFFFFNLRQSQNGMWKTNEMSAYDEVWSEGSKIKCRGQPSNKISHGITHRNQNSCSYSLLTLAPNRALWPGVAEVGLCCQKKTHRGLLGVQCLGHRASLQRVWVPSLVNEPRSCRPCWAAKKEKKM